MMLKPVQSEKLMYYKYMGNLNGKNYASATRMAHVQFTVSTNLRNLRKYHDNPRKFKWGIRSFFLPVLMLYHIDGHLCR